MKKIIIAALLLFGGMTSGQSITNSKLTSEFPENGYSRNVNCVGGWNASHGNPSVQATTDENSWLWMWSHSNLGEGVTTDYDFQAGKSYQVTFKIKTSSNVSHPNDVVLNSTANVRAVSGMTASASNEIPNIPYASEVIWSKPVGIAMNGWKTVKVVFTPENDNSQLWFYPSMTANANENGGARVQMEIDDVVVTPIAKTAANNSFTVLSSNPIKKGELMKIKTNPNEVVEVALFDMAGNLKTVPFAKADNTTIEFLIGDNFKNGIYTLTILNDNNSVCSKNIIIK
ncbi:T9SS type A sorting domain-containing protein [Flavobacterium humi]|uniref:T9SS type A sorting domain-containing protein n=1 Tax=Flavobacterium humi TaxID=2562683 RepID=A0A4Z0L3W5_9FLAO|nr:T9SS type A sorting domain-containing protein [Flavobacterium humi]TGD56917.1 T9SS type A sorting domain-containing protein [Flavobacterium humi]